MITIAFRIEEIGKDGVRLRLSNLTKDRATLKEELFASIVYRTVFDISSRVYKEVEGE